MIYDIINDTSISEKVGTAPNPIVEKMLESRFRWFGHVWRRPVEVPVRRCPDGRESSSYG